MSAPTAEEYEQFRGGVYDPECDSYFDVPKFIEIQKRGRSLTGSIIQARFDGEEAKALVFAVAAGGNCTYYRTNGGKIHKVARFGRHFGYNGKPIKKLISPPNEINAIFIDSNGIKHTIDRFRFNTLTVKSFATLSIDKLPDANYKYCNHSQLSNLTSLTKNGVSDWCFLFGKRSNQIVGILQIVNNELDKDGLCIQGTIRENIVNGQLFYTPLSGLFRGPYQWGEKITLQDILEYIIQPEINGFFGANSFLEVHDPYIKSESLIFFPRISLNLDSFFRHNAGTILPPSNCNN